MTGQSQDTGSAVVLHVEDLWKSYQDGAHPVLGGVDLAVREGEFVCLLGQSGCGKSTLLKCIAGLTGYERGHVSVDRDAIGYVFQTDRLLDWRTVSENLAVVLDGRAIPAEQREERVERYLELVGLRSEADRYPPQLSGGQRQRVALARALSIEPDVLLMDEPFGQLDELTARNLRQEVLDLLADLDRTVLFVTHNAREAAFLSTRVLIMESDRPTSITADFENPLAYPRDTDSKDVLDVQRRIVSALSDSSNG